MTETALAVRSRADLEAMGPADCWRLEGQLEEAAEALQIVREFNDDMLRHWVEVDKLTQKEIAQRVGVTQGRISQRCSRLGIASGVSSRGGRPRGVISANNSEPEVIDAEVVEDDDAPAPRPRKARTSPDGPAHYLPELSADDVEENLRAQALLWFERGLVIKELLDKRRQLDPRSDEDRKLIKKRAALMESTARRLKESL